MIKVPPDLGIHILAQIVVTDGRELAYVDGLRSKMIAVCAQAGLNVVGEAFHQFQPIGVSGVLLLMESHFSLHTWPERNTALVDLFTCAEEDPAVNCLNLFCHELKGQFRSYCLKRRGS